MTKKNQPLIDVDDPTVVDAYAARYHEAKRLYIHSLGLQVDDPPWSDTPHHQKESIRERVRLYFWDDRLPPGRQAEGYTEPHHAHNKWMRSKALQGYRWGPVEDHRRREHPGMVPWRDLPLVHRRKDQLLILVLDDPELTPEQALIRLRDTPPDLRFLNNPPIGAGNG